MRIGADAAPDFVEHSCDAAGHDAAGYDGALAFFTARLRSVRLMACGMVSPAAFAQKATIPCVGIAWIALSQTLPVRCNMLQPPAPVVEADAMHAFEVAIVLAP